MQLAGEIGLSKVILETDNLRTVTAIRHSAQEHSSFGLIIEDIICLAANFESFHCQHSRRGVNKVAHELAQLAKNKVAEKVWLEEVPESEGRGLWML